MTSWKLTLPCTRDEAEAIDFEGAELLGIDPDGPLPNPRGLDLTFADRPWVYMITHVPLAALFGDVAAYNLNSLLALWAGSYFAYLLIL